MLEKIKYNNFEVVVDVPNVIIKGSCEVYKDQNGYKIKNVKYSPLAKTNIREIIAVGFADCNNMKNGKCYNNQKFLGLLKDLPKWHRCIIEI